MDKKIKIMWLATSIGLALFLVMAFVVVNFIMSESLHLLSDVAMYYLKMVMTILVLVLIPTSLKYVNADRYDNTQTLGENNSLTRYGMMCILRVWLFQTIGCVNSIIYVISGDVSFFYLGVIVLLAMLFMRGKTATNYNE